MFQIQPEMRYQKQYRYSSLLQHDIERKHKNSYIQYLFFFYFPLLNFINLWVLLNFPHVCIHTIHVCNYRFIWYIQLIKFKIINIKLIVCVCFFEWCSSESRYIKCYSNDNTCGNSAHDKVYLWSGSYILEEMCIRSIHICI